MVQIAPPPKGSHIQIGDYVNNAGIYTRPGVVVDKKPDGTVVIDTDPEIIHKFHRHTNTSGMSLEEKEKFNGIMDDVMRSDRNEDRINQMQETIDQLKLEPANKKVVETLRNEQAQLIRLSRSLPRVYNYDGDKLKLK